MSKPSRDLVQTRIPPDVKKKLEKAAGVEGLSMASYLRRLLIQHVRAGA
jgi:hypothetical protein